MQQAQRARAIQARRRMQQQVIQARPARRAERRRSRLPPQHSAVIAPPADGPPALRRVRTKRDAERKLDWWRWRCTARSGWSKSEADQAACRGAQAGMLCLHAGRRSRACRTRQPRLHPSAQAPERARGAPPERARRRRPRRGTAPRRRRATGAGAWQRPAGPRPAAAAARAAPGAGRTLRRGRAQRRRPAARQGRRPAGSRARRRAAAPRGARRPAGTRTAPAHRHGVGAGNPQNTLVFCWSERGL